GYGSEPAASARVETKPSLTLRARINADRGKLRLMTTSTRSTSSLGSLFAGVAVLWMKWRSGFVLALRSLWLHKLRAGLSVLGIVIGTAAVIILMGFGKGSMEDALEDIRRQGTTNIIIKSDKPPDDPTAQRTSWVAN